MLDLQLPRDWKVLDVVHHEHFKSSIAAALLMTFVWYGIRLFQDRPSSNKQFSNGQALPKDKENIEAIQPLLDFDWKTTEPDRLRPWKGTYHVNMALQMDSPSNLIRLDKNYPDRVKERARLIAEQGSTVFGCLPSGDKAVEELYTYLLRDYLPVRYPTMFKLSDDKGTFHNLIMGKQFPTTPPEGDMQAALRILGETVEDDMFLLSNTPEGHHVDAFLCCFPAGFDGSEKLGKVLAGVHAPVPSYGKIAMSMERYFSRMKVGKPAKRANWSIQTDSELFHCKPHATEDNDGSDEQDEFEIEDAYLRVELQTLTRLPRTQSLLFSFKTHLEPITDLKEDGTGSSLAAAIDGLDRGNAPGMKVYKGGHKWAPRVYEYLCQDA